MASIHEYAASDGSKRYRVLYRDPAHHQRQKRGFKTKKAAKDYIARVTVAINDQDYIDPHGGRTLIDDLGETWLEGKRGAIKPKYYGDLESAWRVHVKPQWGERTVASIRHSEVQAWVSQLSGGDASKGMPGRSPTVVIRAYGVLKGIFDSALADGLLRRSPCEGTQLPRKVRKERVYLTPEQVLSLAEHAGHHKALILTLGFCGLRWGEAAALRVKHVDQTNHRLAIRLNYVRSGSNHYEGAPKTWETRDVPVPLQVLDAIMGDCQGKSPEDLVFTDEDGGRIREQTIRKNGWYRQALDASGCPYLTCHDLRHTAASIAISSGANVKAVQRMLGHKSAQMTLDTYADLFDTDLDAVAVSIGRRIDEARTGNKLATHSDKTGSTTIIRSDSKPLKTQR